MKSRLGVDEECKVKKLLDTHCITYSYYCVVFVYVGYVMMWERCGVEDGELWSIGED